MIFQNTYQKFDHYIFSIVLQILRFWQISNFSWLTNFLRFLLSKSDVCDKLAVQIAVKQNTNQASFMKALMKRKCSMVIITLSKSQRSILLLRSFYFFHFTSFYFFTSLFLFKYFLRIWTYLEFNHDTFKCFVKFQS